MSETENRYILHTAAKSDISGHTYSDSILLNSGTNEYFTVSRASANPRDSRSIFWKLDYHQRFPLKSTKMWRYRKRPDWFCLLKFPLRPRHPTVGKQTRIVQLFGTKNRCRGLKWLNTQNIFPDELNFWNRKSLHSPHGRKIWHQWSHIFRFYITQLWYKRIFHCSRASANPKDSRSIFWKLDYHQRFPLKSTKMWRYRKHPDWFCLLKFPLRPHHPTVGKQTRIVQLFGTKNRCWCLKWLNTQNIWEQIQITGLFWGWQ